jgi:hypothetical protein
MKCDLRGMRVILFCGINFFGLRRGWDHVPNHKMSGAVCICAAVRRACYARLSQARTPDHKRNFTSPHPRSRMQHRSRWWQL